MVFRSVFVTVLLGLLLFITCNSKISFINEAVYNPESNSFVVVCRISHKGEFETRHQMPFWCDVILYLNEKSADFRVFRTTEWVLISRNAAETVSQPPSDVEGSFSLSSFPHQPPGTNPLQPGYVQSPALLYQQNPNLHSHDGNEYQWRRLIQTLPLNFSHPDCFELIWRCVYNEVENFLQFKIIIPVHWINSTQMNTGAWKCMLFPWSIIDPNNVVQIASNGALNSLDKNFMEIRIINSQYAEGGNSLDKHSQSLEWRYTTAEIQYAHAFRKHFDDPKARPTIYFAIDCTDGIDRFFTWKTLPSVEQFLNLTFTEIQSEYDINSHAFRISDIDKIDHDTIVIASLLITQKRSMNISHFRKFLLSPDMVDSGTGKFIPKCTYTPGMGNLEDSEIMRIATKTCTLTSSDHFKCNLLSFSTKVKHRITILYPPWNQGGDPSFGYSSDGGDVIAGRLVQVRHERNAGSSSQDSDDNQSFAPRHTDTTTNKPQPSAIIRGPNIKLRTPPRRGQGNEIVSFDGSLGSEYPLFEMPSKLIGIGRSNGMKESASPTNNESNYLSSDQQSEGINKPTSATVLSPSESPVVLPSNMNGSGNPSAGGNDCRPPKPEPIIYIIYEGKFYVNEIFALTVCMLIISSIGFCVAIPLLIKEQIELKADKIAAENMVVRAARKSHSSIEDENIFGSISSHDSWNSSKADSTPPLSNNINKLSPYRSNTQSKKKKIQRLKHRKNKQETVF